MRNLAEILDEALAMGNSEGAISDDEAAFASRALEQYALTAKACAVEKQRFVAPFVCILPEGHAGNHQASGNIDWPKEATT